MKLDEAPYSLNLAYKNQIDKVCVPLLDMGINHFVMQLLFNDFSTFVLSNYSPNLIMKDNAKIDFKYIAEHGRAYPIYNLVRKHSECTFVFSAFSDNEVTGKIDFYKDISKDLEGFCIQFVDTFIDLIISCNPSYRFSFILTNKSLRDAVIRQEYEKEINLSTREQECLLLSAQGKKPKEIARALNISYHTVEQYLKQVRKTLKCDTVAQAIVECIHRGIIGRVSSI